VLKVPIVYRFSPLCHITEESSAGKFPFNGFHDIVIIIIIIIIIINCSWVITRGSGFFT